MNIYSLSTLVSFALLGLGAISMTWGVNIYMQNHKSKSSIKFINICLCVFLWNFGYAWMSSCHNEPGFALIPRAIALFAICLFMGCVLSYVTYLSKYPRKYFWSWILVLGLGYFIAWFYIIQPSAVTFVMTPWGYWYYSRMTWARILQFAAIGGAVVYFYYVLAWWKKNTTSKRNLHIIGQLKWFGVILSVGYALDTLIPTLFHTAAVPGSSVAAFFCALLIFHISKSNRTLGSTVTNVAEYVFRDVTTPILIFNEKDELELCNDKSLDFFGKTIEELKATNKEALFAIYDEKEQVYFNAEKNIYYKQATTIVNDQFGDLLYTMVFLADVTNEQQVMNVLKESREEADEANRAKSIFLANMSHEIRTPMNAIIGMSDIILQDNTLDEENRQNVLNIKSAGVNLMSIINDILDISKIESGKYELVDDTYDVPSFLHDIHNMIQVRTNEKNLTLRMEVNPDVPNKLIGDNKRVRQILVNILGNAVKYTQKGSVTLKVDWNYDVLKPCMIFKVEDTGIGIKEEDLESIFTIFNQVDTRKNRNIQGTGLGLAISRQLANLMGGNVTVTSTYGEGSCFTIFVYQKLENYTKIGESIAKALETNEYKPLQMRNEIVIVPKPQAKILVVDDMKANLLVAKGIMKPYQMQVDTAISGMEAVEMVQKTDYDIVFMDHMMPEMDGVDTTKMIRELPGEKYQKLVIIALTANTLEESKELLLNSGMQDFLGKPIQRVELDAILNKWL